MEFLNKKIGRILELYAIIKDNNGITKKEIVSKLYKSSRTIERDLDDLKVDFGIYTKKTSHYKYIIDKKETEQKYIDRIEKVISLFGTTLFQLKHNGESSFVEDEETTIGLGNRYLDEFYDAITNNFKVAFTYKSFWKDEAENVIISPILLKQHNQRWYVVANEKENKMYSLDRMSSIEIMLEEPFNSHGTKKGMFDNVVGISQPHLETERIVLAFDPRQGKYIKSLPLHSTQHIILENEKEFVVELNVGVNWELKEKIKMQGSLVKVIEPKHLADEIREDLTLASKQYN